MNTLKLSSLARAVALCAGSLLFCAGASAAGDKAPYNEAKTSAKATYEADKKACDAMKDNAKDICVAEAKAKRVKTEENAEAAYKNTPKAREHAIHEIAEADYKVAKERCDDKKGNDKDVCIKEAKAAATKHDAEYAVAREKCDTYAGEARDYCLGQAKQRFGKS